MRPKWIATASLAQQRSFAIVAVVILLLGAGLRLVGLFDDFWLDEIWSWSFARSSTSAMQVLFGLHHDNNHHLITLWMYLCGNQPHWYVYRLPSYFAGLATILGSGILAGDVAFACSATVENDRSSGRAAASAKLSSQQVDQSRQFALTTALVTMFLSATSNWACVYSTEARGYSIAGAAAVFSTLLLRNISSSSRTVPPGLRLIFCYALISIVGFLSHLSYVTVFAAQFAWATFRFLRSGMLVPILVCFLPTIAFVAFWWLIDLRYVQSGGGPISSLLIVAPEALALPMGVDHPEWLVFLSAGIVLFGLIGAVAICCRANRADAALFVLYLLVAPVLVYCLRSNGLLYSRHFFVVWMPLFALLGMAIVQSGVRSNGVSLLPILAPLTFWLGTNGWEFVQFACYGRGGYSNAVNFLVEETKNEFAREPRAYSIGSDHDFRNQLVLGYYLSRLPADTHLAYANQGSWPQEKVDWLILHEMKREHTPAQNIEIKQHRYELVRFEPYAAPVGWHWAIYRLRD